MHRRIIRFLFCSTVRFVIAALLFVSPTWTAVQAGGPVTNCTEAGLDAALSGAGSITFNCNGTNSPAVIVIKNPKSIVADTTIDGGGKITLSGGNSTRIFSVAANFTLENITLALGNASGTGNASDGGCIWSYGNLHLENVVVEKCYAARDGGGIFNYTGGLLSINNSTIVTNTANHDCGGICDYGASVSINGSAIVGNSAQTPTPAVSARPAPS